MPPSKDSKLFLQVKNSQKLYPFYDHMPVMPMHLEHLILFSMITIVYIFVAVSIFCGVYTSGLSEKFNTIAE
jgi:hypothetical protein